MNSRSESAVLARKSLICSGSCAITSGGWRAGELLQGMRQSQCFSMRVSVQQLVEPHQSRASAQFFRGGPHLSSTPICLSGDFFWHPDLPAPLPHSELRFGATSLQFTLSRAAGAMIMAFRHWVTPTKEHEHSWPLTPRAHLAPGLLFFSRLGSSESRSSRAFASTLVALRHLSVGHWTPGFHAPHPKSPWFPGLKEQAGLRFGPHSAQVASWLFVHLISC